MKNYKKSIILVIILMIIFAIPSIVNADTEETAQTEINGVQVNWTYTVNESNQIENLKCTNPEVLTGNITIPSDINGKTVISLGNEAFKAATGIAEITIPNSATEIGSYAFSGCTSLSKINFGTGVQSLGINAFERCTALTSITIPKSLTGHCGNYPFNGCTNITSVTFEEGITRIPAFICENLTGITEKTIPNSVTEIDSYAFSKCTSLKKITILDNVKNISMLTFENHHEDLTIYCYEGSVAAQYAINNNIKYVYLTKPAGDSNNSVENNKAENGGIKENGNKDI